MWYRHQHLVQGFIFSDGLLGMVTVIVEALLRAVNLLGLTGLKWFFTRFAGPQYILYISAVDFVPSSPAAVRAEVILRFDFSVAKHTCPDRPTSHVWNSGT